MSDLRLGVIGIGNMGSAHAVNISKGMVKGAVLSAVCDINQSRLEWAKRFDGVLLYNNYKTMLKEKVCDALIIAVPHYYHAPIAIDALNVGYHVLTEKPEAVKASDALKMNEAAEKSGKVFGIMFNQRTNPLFIKARETVKSGQLGSPVRLTWIITNWYRTQAYYDSGVWRASWDGEGGGVLLNQSPHNLDIMQWIFGMPDSVYAICDEGHYHNIEVEDNAILNLKYNNGARAQFITSTGECPGTNRLEIVGSKGKIVLENGKIRIWKLPFDEREYCFNTNNASFNDKCEYTEFSSDELGKESAHIGVLNAFAGAIRGECSLIAKGEEGINQLLLTNAAYLSAWCNKEVTLPLDTELFDRMLEEKRKRSGYKEKLAASLADGSMSSRWKVNW